MPFKFETKLVSSKNHNLSIFFALNDKKIINTIKSNYEGIDEIITKDARFSTDYLSLNIYHQKGRVVIIIGLGEEAQLTTERAAHAIAMGAREGSKSHSNAQIFINTIKLNQELLTSIAIQSTIMGCYEFNNYKSKKVPPIKLTTCEIITNAAIDESIIKEAIAIGTGINEARNLSNMPSNDLNPTSFVEKIKSEFSKEKSMKVTIIDEKEAKKKGMNALVGVGQGSAYPSYLAIIEYSGDKSSKEKIALVGKGITFDTGGISIKPSKSMKDMKGDMSGAAAVFGTMTIVKKVLPKSNIIALIPIAENMPSGTAQRPGDVVTAYNGTTIEIVNTDAEGRLILADALSYAVTQKATQIFDIATLTGAAVVALGNETLGMLGNNQSIMDKIIEKQSRTFEKVWQLPLYDEFKEYLKSNVADISHCFEGRAGGTCTAAKFLEQFVNQTPWVHFDMAPKMENSKTSGFDIKGMSGAGVRTLYEIIK